MALIDNLATSDLISAYFLQYFNYLICYSSLNLTLTLGLLQMVHQDAVIFHNAILLLANLKNLRELHDLPQRKMYTAKVS